MSLCRYCNDEIVWLTKIGGEGGVPFNAVEVSYDELEITLVQHHCSERREFLVQVKKEAQQRRKEYAIAMANDLAIANHAKVNFVCPKCKAEKGDPCKNLRDIGEFNKHPHKERMMLAAEDMK